MKTVEFVRESNRIENVFRDPTKEEIEAHSRFISLPNITIVDLVEFVSIYQPTATLRIRAGMNVRVGYHIPPKGGEGIAYRLQELLDNLQALSPYRAHVTYETLHPFTDCNGRSGRALWAWHMMRKYGEHPRGFLHPFYYQSLDDNRVRPKNAEPCQRINFKERKED